jgi:aminoglycoside phosphotransferase (APT) family kinase protein
MGIQAECPALLLDWCAGVPLFEALRDRPASLPSLGQAFGRMQAEMHRIPAPAGLRSNWVDWPVPAEAELAARLRALDLAPPRLLHFDYHPLNVLAADGQLSAVIDWTNAFAGDPRADFARTASVLRLMPRVERLNRVTRLGALVLEMAWRLGYGPVGGDLALHYAWAGAALEADVAGRHAPRALEPIRRWTRAWRRRAGLPSVAER